MRPRLSGRLQSEGTSPELAAQLRYRLMAVAGFFLLGFLLFLARDLGFGRSNLLLLRVGVVAILATLLFVLLQEPLLPLRRLRVIEAALFISVMLYLGVSQYHFAVDAVRQASEAGLVRTLASTTRLNFTVMVIYGLLVPNTWRRAAIGAGLIWLSTITVYGLIYWHVHEEQSFLERTLSPEFLSENFLTNLLGFVLAIFGSHIIHRLRTEADAGKQLGTYRLLRRIGGGGMGEVYLAEHTLLKRPSAIKLIHPDRAGDPKALLRFEREVHASAALTHPNTIDIYDYGQADDGSFYYVMQHLRGLTLSQIVNRHGPQPPARVVYLLRQICGSLGEAHAAGLIHRDLKPANVFAAHLGGRWDVVKVLDFGLVKPMESAPGEESLTAEDVVAGTPSYMSPEQATGAGRLDGRSDLFAVGALAYVLLTGSTAFEGESRMETLAMIVRDPVIPPRAVRPEIPADLEFVVLRCLAKHREDRFANAAALDLALASCQCAAEWDDARAEAWWKANEPEIAALPPLDATTGTPSA